MEINRTLEMIVSQAARNTCYDMHRGNKHIRKFPIRRLGMPFQQREYDRAAGRMEYVWAHHQRNQFSRGTARMDYTSIVLGSYEGFDHPSWRFHTNDRPSENEDGIIRLEHHGWRTLHLLYENIPIAVIGNTGRIRILQPATLSRGVVRSVRAYAWRLNVLMDLFYYKTEEGGSLVKPPLTFAVTDGKLGVFVQHETIEGATRDQCRPPGCAWNATHTKIQVCNGDVIDTNTWKYYSRPMERLAPMSDITTGEGNYPISQGVLTGFLREPQSVVLRSRVRSEINRVLPDDVTDRQRLDEFLESERLLIRVREDEPDQFVISRLPQFLPTPPVPA